MMMIDDATVATPVLHNSKTNKCLL